MIYWESVSLCLGKGADKGGAGNLRDFFLFPEVEGRVGSTLGPGDEEGALEAAAAVFYSAVYWVV